MTNLNDNDLIFNMSYGGVCIFLSESGCLLPFKLRPTSGRHVIPAEDFCCSSPDSEQGSSKWCAAKSWNSEEYQDLFRELIFEKCNF